MLLFFSNRSHGVGDGGLRAVRSTQVYVHMDPRRQPPKSTTKNLTVSMYEEKRKPRLNCNIGYLIQRIKDHHQDYSNFRFGMFTIFYRVRT